MTRGLTVDVDLPGRVRADLAVDDGGILVLVGPNGAGKSSLLGAVAGTLAPSARVRVGDRDWTGLPPQQRSVGLVHQDHRLFPHLSVLENVAFGPRARGTSRRQARAAASGWLDRLGIAAYADRRPHQLSGGQAQRVAIARALATGPDVLLLDEPCAALDVAVANDLRELLAVHLEEYDGIVLLASHDALDVHALAGRVVVLEQGRVVQDAGVAEIAEAPETAHAARLLGLNVLRGTATGVGEVALADGGTIVAAGRATGAVLATFAPSAVTVTRDRPVGSARNAWPVRIVTAAGLAGTTRLHLRGDHPQGPDLRADVTPAAVAQLGLVAGTQVWASVKATEVTVFETAGTADDR